MTDITDPVTDIPRLDRAGYARLAATEYARMLDTLRGLTPGDWPRPTDCAAWDVRALAGHVLGGTELVCTLREFVHQLRAGSAAARGRPTVDGMTEVQVRERAPLGTDELIDRFGLAGPRAARVRARLPRPFRWIPMTARVGDVDEKWRLGYLFDIILTRDTWMHRVDLCRATDTPMTLTGDHDGRIVADVVREWAGRHGRPFAVELTGPAGGVFASPTACSESISMDAVEFCRVLSGRGRAGTGLLARPVPF
ncbi:maleylpyruvate isomerase family mycothiol-dependent enzyme [Rhodococcus sp. NPDC003318]|uniref:maleylpyruvate isomerase family mycothiol-dependent enzyme n=1 Tax=Rhodococcus sp. NPDC003318 TaxID=3364503 RepID=UPI00369DF2EA